MEKKRNKTFLHKFLVKAAGAVSAAFIENHLLQVSNYSIVSEKFLLPFKILKLCSFPICTANALDTIMCG